MAAAVDRRIADARVELARDAAATTDERSAVVALVGLSADGESDDADRLETVLHRPARRLDPPQQHSEQDDRG
jgi:hypothetical protein